MNTEVFQSGLLDYTATDCDPKHVLTVVGSLREWDNGFLVFANREIQLSQVDFILEQVIKDRVNALIGALDGVEGYLIELNLWRHRHGHWQEIVAEREGTGFFVQLWTLSKASNEAANCSFRSVQTWLARSNKRLRALEVVCPLDRLHFFLSVEQDALTQLIGEK